MQIRPLFLAVAGILSFATFLCADTIVLKDGTILGGVVKQVKDGYEITSADGKATFVPVDDVKSIKLSNDGKVTEQNAKERLASLRRSVDADAQLDRIIERYKQFIEMNRQTDASADAAKDLALWETRKTQGMVKVGAKWMTPAQRDQYLIETAKLANAIADQIAAGDVVGASDRIARGLEADPTNLSLAYLDGVLQLRRNRYNEAKRSFDIVFDQIPDHPPTLFNEAAIATNFNRWPVAIPMLEKVMTITPNHPEILNGVTEFLRLVPDSHRRSVAFDRLQSIYNAQEAIVGKEMAKKGLYRFGSTWADQAKIDEMKKKLEEFEAKKKTMQDEYDASQEKMRQLAKSIDTVDRQLAEIERDRINVDPITGRTTYMPRPQYYYDLQADRDRYVRDLQQEKNKSDDLRKQAKDLESQAPQPPYSGRVIPIGEAGVPIVLPAGATDQTGAIPATQPEAVPSLTMPPPTAAPATSPAP